MSGVYTLPERPPAHTKGFREFFGIVAITNKEKGFLNPAIEQGTEDYKLIVYYDTSAVSGTFWHGKFSARVQRGR